ncbi:MAG: hypothetical protein AAF633_13415 [Chloroflexota bacterium]
MDSRSDSDSDKEKVKSASRRALITGFQTEAQEISPETKEVNYEWELPTALRKSLSALFYIAQKGEPSEDNFAAKIGVVTPLDLAGSRSMFELADSISYTAPRSNQIEVLGKQSEKLQGHLRNIKKWIVQQSNQFGIDPPPNLILYLSGAFTNIYADKLGRQLGGVFGFSKAAEPLHLTIIDPIMKESLEQEIEQIKSLKKLIEGRKVSLSLGLESHISSLVSFEKALSHQLFDCFSLSLMRFERLSELKAVLEKARREDVSIILNLSRGEPSGTEVMMGLELAKAFRPKLIYPSDREERFINSCNSLIINKVIDN